jgi:hypothetical protein
MAFLPIGSVLEAADAADSDYFGMSVSLSADGNVLAVGARTWESTGTDRGGVYLYDRNGSSWTQRGSVLEAADAADSDYFGMSVSLSADGNVLAVGARTWEGTAGTDRGGVYLYDRNGSSWTQRGSVLEASDAADSDSYGRSVSLSADGNVLAVGAHTWESTGTDRGGAYLYDRNGSSWTQRGSVLAPADAADSDNFSVSVSLSADGNVLAVGAYAWEGAAGADRGGVYIYDRNESAWTQRGSVLEAADAADNDYFGVSVSLSADGNVLAVGAYVWEGAAGTDRGDVYIYDRNGSAWTQRGSVLEAADAADSDYFGTSVSLSADGNVLAVGANAWEGAAGTNRGGVYYYSNLVLSGNITESLDISSWRVSAYRTVDGALWGTTTTTGSTYSITAVAHETYNLILTPTIHYAWLAYKIAALNDYVVAANPDTTPHLWKVTTAGAFAATEATWNLSGTTTQGTAELTYIAPLVNPIGLGPKIPAGA